jgi:hypothetical protein
VIAPGLYVSPWRDTYDPSRIFLHGLVWQLKVQGRHVVMAPNRITLLVTGDEDIDNLTRMAELAEKQLSVDRPVSGTAIRLDGSEWVPFMPVQQSPAYAPFEKARLRSLMIDYTDQKLVLDKWHEANAEDVFVAKLFAQRFHDGPIVTWTSWTWGVTNALLPKADLIAFTMGAAPGDDRKPAVKFAKWDDVTREAGDLLKPTDYFPPRFRVRQFPSDEQLDRVAHVSPIAALEAKTDGLETQRELK